MNKREIYLDQNKTLARIHNELEAGFKVIEKHPKTVTFFGSSRLTSSSPYCVLAQELAKRIVKELGYAIVTGGGPGIMEAGNKGAKEAGGESIGFTINLPTEQKINPFVTTEVNFNHFITRKTALTFAAEAWIFFPGGYGTLDELFNILTMMQTKKIPKTPIILFGTEFWNELNKVVKEVMVDKYETVYPEESRFYTITDNEDEIIDIIKKAPVQEWWKDFEIPLKD